jgi:hypothetical protein
LEGHADEPGFDPALKRLCAVVVLGAIMSILGTTIVNVAIDTLGGRPQTSLSTIQWVTSLLLARKAAARAPAGTVPAREGAPESVA